MTGATFEGVVEQGKISLPSTVLLPEKLRVDVVVPDYRMEQVARILSPHLAHSEQADDFRMEVRLEDQDADVQ